MGKGEGDSTPEGSRGAFLFFLSDRVTVEFRVMCCVFDLFDREFACFFILIHSR